jgi:mRNA interferase MazF
MTSYEPGDVVLVRFPFTDLAAAKKRPAVVVSPQEFSRRHGDVVLMALTSRPQAGDALRIEGWKAAGLAAAAWVKPVLVTLDSRLIDRRLGKLPEEERPRVANAMHALIDREFLVEAQRP